MSQVNKFKKSWMEYLGIGHKGGLRADRADSGEAVTAEFTSEDVLESPAPAKVEEDAYKECDSCKKSFLTSEIKSNFYVCPNCGYHFNISAKRRLKLLVDKGTFRQFKYPEVSENPLDFPEYEDKLQAQRGKTGLDEALIAGVAEVDGHELVVAVLTSRFLMGSMGVAVGERIAYAVECAEKLKLPLLIFSASGGARMQEGIMSLMQMAKTSAAIERFNQKGGLYISYLTHPTTGGVSASFAFLGDIMLAEPKALIGFAGPRVIEQTIRQKLPEGFQRSEYLLEHGFIDRIVERKEMRNVISQLLKLHGM